jgi:hypothetical protein
MEAVGEQHRRSGALVPKPDRKAVYVEGLGAYRLQIYRKESKHDSSI